MLKRNSLLVTLILVTLIVFSFSGCRANLEKPDPESDKDDTPEVPEILTEMEENILRTIYGIDSIRGLATTMQNIEEEKEEITEESEVDQNQQEKEEAAKDKVNLKRMINENSILIPVLVEEDVEGEEMIDPQEPPEDVAELWYQIQENLYNIHLQWNVLERHLQDVKISKDDVEAFEALLEELTHHIDEKAIEGSLYSGNQLLGSLADFRNQFKTEVPYEMYKLKYHTRKSLLLANVEDYDAAGEETEKMKELLSGLRQDIIEKDGEIELQKLELSIEDLQHEIAAENFHLIQIKSAIVMKNVVLVTDVMEGNS